MVLLVPKTYGEIVLVFDTIIMTISLLFRKPKHRAVKSTLNHRFIGWYIVISSVVALIASHFVSYASSLNYFTGLFLNSLIFYVGVKILV
ncbi:hypothetical protein SSSV4_ORF89 [Sulfolobus spindle-shaped virus 4]|uniref:Uncharacterized protein n=1 Tax=Sulfolobus spindle-shaped virus 4 TaxID=459290 RepID=A8TKG6_9VIRU|nr:hypothetical protein SSSV4_ORF89 [Sulfolobus spindle-shaped virus 4]ABV26196.1 hypothetical protein [Sulfolobus spindle-shaped virus 4]